MRVIKILAMFLLLSVGGCLGGYLVASTGNNAGAIRWVQLSDPPQKPVRIIELGGNGSDAHSITVEDASGSQYECCGPWPATWKLLTVRKERYGPTCGQVTSTLLEQLPAKPLDCAFISQFEWVTEQYYAALLPDGSLWRWRYYYGLNTLFNGMVIGAVLGLVIGIIILIFRQIRRRSAA